MSKNLHRTESSHKLPHVLGIDPGFDGAIAFYEPDNLIVFDMPCDEVTFMKKATKGKYKGKMRPSVRREVNLKEARRIIHTSAPVTHAFIEWVTAGSQQGATSMFRFGESFGEIKGILTCLNTTEGAFEKIKPQKWKKYYGLSSDKKESLKLARELFPDYLDLFKRVKDNGRAEAALIAKYGWDTSYKNEQNLAKDASNNGSFPSAAHERNRA